MRNRTRGNNRTAQGIAVDYMLVGTGALRPDKGKWAEDGGSVGVPHVQHCPFLRQTE